TPQGQTPPSGRLQGGRRLGLRESQAQLTLCSRFESEVGYHGSSCYYLASGFWLRRRHGVAREFPNRSPPSCRVPSCLPQRSGEKADCGVRGTLVRPGIRGPVTWSEPGGGG